MIEEAMRWIRDITDAARKSNWVRRPGDPPHVIWLHDASGNVSRLETEPGYRTLSINRFSDLIDLVKNHFDTHVAEAQRMAIAYNSNSVSLIFDTQNGREQASIVLEPTDEKKFFEAREQNPLIEAKQLYALMRYELHKTHNDPKFLKQISSLSFVDHDAASQSRERGRESLGANIEKQVAGNVELPDELQSFSVRHYMNPELDIRLPLVCWLDPDPSTRRWFLRPQPESLAAAQQAIMDQVGHLLRDGLKDVPGVKIYQGLYSQDQTILHSKNL